MIEYLLNIVFIIFIYSILSISINLLIGYLGVLAISQAAFFGVGAYLTAILSTQYSFSYLNILVVTLIVSSILGLLLGYPSLKIKNESFVVVTFAFQILLHELFVNWESMTEGAIGIGRIPKIYIPFLSFDSDVKIILLALSLMLIVYFIINSLVKSGFGRVSIAIREDELFTLSLGKNILRTKLSLFILSSIFASVTGIIYAAYTSYVNPSSFDLMESVTIISMVIIGGASSTIGPIIGTVIVITIPEIFSFLGTSSSIAANIRQIFYGLTLIFLMRFRPSGIMGKYDFSSKLSR